MQDEQFMQGWNAGHDRFSVDLDGALGKLAARFSQWREARGTMRNSYGIPARTRRSLSSGARASLHGLAATGLTVMLWGVVLALATPAPGLAAPAPASVQACACPAHPPLA